MIKLAVLKNLRKVTQNRKLIVVRQMLCWPYSTYNHTLVLIYCHNVGHMVMVSPGKRTSRLDKIAVVHSHAAVRKLVLQTFKTYPLE